MTSSSASWLSTARTAQAGKPGDDETAQGSSVVNGTELVGRVSTLMEATLRARSSAGVGDEHLFDGRLGICLYPSGTRPCLKFGMRAAFMDNKSKVWQAACNLRCVEFIWNSVGCWALH